VDELETFHVVQQVRPASSLKDRLYRALLPAGSFVRLSVPVTRAARPIQRRRARSQVAAGRRHLHLGSGPNPLPGWVNVDLLGWKVDVAWDLGRPLPFPDGSMTQVFTEHVIEHLPYETALVVLQEAHRVLEPGGRLRVVVPDAGRFMRSYSGDGSWLAEVRPDASTPMLAVADVLFRHGHLSAWDAHTLCEVLASLGFRDVSERAFGETAMDPCPDTPARAFESLYVEATA